MALTVLPRLIAAAEAVKKAEVGARYAPEPWEEILPGDNVVNPTGDFPMELKQVYIDWQLAQAEVEHATTNIRLRAFTEGKDASDVSYAARHAEIQCLSAVAQALSVTFNAEVRVIHPDIANKPQVIVRKGWIVVWRDPPQAGPVPNVAPPPPGPPH